MDNQQAKELLKKYNNGTASTEEKDLVESWFLHLKSNQAEHELSEEHIEKNTNAVWASVQKQLSVRTTRFWPRVAVAASIILVIGAYLLLNNINKQDLIPAQATLIDAEPGRNRATLTLANGKKINLDDAANGQIAAQAGLKISKTADGQLVYTVGSEKLEAGSRGANSDMPTAIRHTLNTITTPKGGQYQVRLPDGTKVWLNAASTLTYPTDLSISETRVVNLSGEAYFEVAHLSPSGGAGSGRSGGRERTPFLVKTATQQVEVLGTHFNVNSYGDNNRTITTLAEGSVKVSPSFRAKGEISKADGIILKPGEQAINQTNNLTVQPADLETALAWKNGNMIFKSEPLENIMKDVERWYNVKVVYEGQLRKRVFSGGIARSSKLSVLLDLLKYNDINFEIQDTPQGKTLIVKP